MNNKFIIKTRKLCSVILNNRADLTLNNGASLTLNDRASLTLTTVQVLHALTLITAVNQSPLHEYAYN